MNSIDKIRLLELKLEQYESLCRDQATQIIDLKVEVRYLKERLNEAGSRSANMGNRVACTPYSSSSQKEVR